MRAFQVNGHAMAQLDPLGLDARPVPIELDPALYGFTEADLDREFFLGTWRMKGFLSEDNPVQTLRQILARLRETYCGNIGYEYMHIADRDMCNWLRERIEVQRATPYSKERKKVLLDRLAWSDMFENFLSNKYGRRRSASASRVARRSSRGSRRRSIRRPSSAWSPSPSVCPTVVG